jgi:hypothetical protein
MILRETIRHYVQKNLIFSVQCHMWQKSIPFVLIFQNKNKYTIFKRKNRFDVHLEFGRHFVCSCLATLVLFFYHKKPIK